MSVQLYTFLMLLLTLWTEFSVLLIVYQLKVHFQNQKKHQKMLEQVIFDLYADIHRIRDNTFLDKNNTQEILRRLK